MNYEDPRGVKFVPGEHQWTDQAPTSAMSAGPPPAVGGQTYADWHNRYYASTNAASNEAARSAVTSQVAASTASRQAGKPAQAASQLNAAGNSRRNYAATKSL